MVPKHLRNSIIKYLRFYSVDGKVALTDTFVYWFPFGRNTRYNTLVWGLRPHETNLKNFINTAVKANATAAGREAPPSPQCYKMSCMSYCLSYFSNLFALHLT